MPRGILFDFDYTLADSSPAVIECVAFALERMGLPRVSDQAVRQTIGLSLPRTFVQLAGNEHAERADEFRTHFRAKSDLVMVARTSLLPPARGAVERLAARGFRLGIVSTKYRVRIEDVLNRDGLAEPFEVIVGGEDVSEFKPSPEGLLAAVGRWQFNLDEVLYVGDSLIDAETAERAGVDFAAVLSGMTVAREFEAFPSLAVFGDVGELAAWL